MKFPNALVLMRLPTFVAEIAAPGLSATPPSVRTGDATAAGASVAARTARPARAEIRFLFI